MQKMSAVKRAILCAACIALCYVLPMAFHAFGAGSVFLPMHIPAFLCGLICGWPYGLLCGLAGPAISSALTNMPPVAMLPTMMVELAVYGVVSGVMMGVVRTKKLYADLYISLITAILAGRVLAGVVRALLFSPDGYSMAAWVSGYVVTSWPGTLIQLIFVPAIVFALMQARLIPERYPKP